MWTQWTCTSSRNIVAHSPVLTHKRSVMKTLSKCIINLAGNLVICGVHRANLRIYYFCSLIWTSKCWPCHNSDNNFVFLPCKPMSNLRKIYRFVDEVTLVSQHTSLYPYQWIYKQCHKLAHQNCQHQRQIQNPYVLPQYPETSLSRVLSSL